MASPLYNYQKEQNGEREENKNKFIVEHYDQLMISKRYISQIEKEEIYNKYTINKDDLDELVYEGNDEFIEYRRPFILNDFNRVLKDNEFFDKELYESLKNKYHQGGYDFFNDIQCDIRIKEKNTAYRFKIINSFKEEVYSYEFIDENVCNILKSKFNDFDYVCIKKSEFIRIIHEKNQYYNKLKMSKILNEFDRELKNHDFINDELCDELKIKFNNFNYEYTEKSDFYDMIENKNSLFKDFQLKRFTKELNSCENVIDNTLRLKFKSKYNTEYYNFYDELNFDGKINKHNEQIKPKIIKKVLLKETGCISSKKCHELKKIYSDEVMDWDGVISDYNDSFDNHESKSNGLDLDIGENLNALKSRLIKEDPTFQYGLSSDKISNGVYYLFKYIPCKKRDDYGPNEFKFSKMMWKYKNGYEIAIDFFTNELMEAIEAFSNNIIPSNIDSIALVSIPPSKIFKNKNTPMRKSIYRIFHANNIHLIDSPKEIKDYGNLLYRFDDVPTSHTERRATYDEHIESIICTKRDLSDENMAFILMDDITASGNIMDACKDILIDNGVSKRGIYKLVIGGTVGGKRWTNSKRYYY